MLNDNQRGRHGVDATRRAAQQPIRGACRRPHPPAPRCSALLRCPLPLSPLCSSLPPSTGSSKVCHHATACRRRRASLTTSLTAAVLLPLPAVTSESHLRMSRYGLLCARRRQPWEGQARGGVVVCICSIVVLALGALSLAAWQTRPTATTSVASPGWPTSMLEFLV